MDVLIKGMKMPKGCITCMFKFESLFNRTMWCEWLDDPLGDYSKCDEKWRHPACPLVEVPPHGRLIDGIDLLKAITENAYIIHHGHNEVEYGMSCFGIMQAISEAPTIIEAEEEEEE